VNSEQNPPCLLRTRLTKKSGPGEKTPDLETNMIWIPISSSVIFEVPLKHIGYIMYYIVLLYNTIRR
jgi:hypothetical protein